MELMEGMERWDMENVEDVGSGPEETITMENVEHMEPRTSRPRRIILYALQSDDEATTVWPLRAK
jgi:hypothetical protein